MSARNDIPKGEAEVSHEETGRKMGVLAADEVELQRLEHALAVKPASLQPLTDEELKELDKRMVRKMDLVIL